MIPLLSPEESRALDRHAIDGLGVPGVVLMENAGAGAYRALVERFGGKLSSPVIFGGPGNNGGDAWVVARHLENAGIATVPVLVGERGQVSGDARVNLAALEAIRGGVHEGEVDYSSLCSAATVIVDGLFGTGLDRDLGGAFAAAVRAINASDAPVLALDIPTGVHGGSGAVLGSAVRADVTTTFAAHKLGLHQHPGVALAGQVLLVSIGVPAPESATAMLLERADVARAVPMRAVGAHKGRAGRVWVCAGSPGKVGAALLAGRGALRAGAGLVTLAPRGEVARALVGAIPELMVEALPQNVQRAVELLTESCDAAVVGPGFGLDGAAMAVALGIARGLPVPTVLDADALTALAGSPDLSLARAPAPRVLTPHAGEAARLLGTTSAQVQADRYGAARRLAAATGATVVLKGARTLIASADGDLRVCPFGTPALATAGTGDVLAGAIGAFLGAGLSPVEAASSTVVVHALGGEATARGDRGLLASEVADALPKALEHCRKTLPS
ncbi:MAG: NAD(P)H-hydrate dehydratase [Deltaproteobacteria bacterium]|nr:NAD(P)H-hydrate dehydratase [Deltaproteobacteria bacterium]